MRKFEITNPDKFTGTAYLVYNDRETLCMIDFRETNMDAETILHFKRIVPITIGQLVDGLSFSKETMVVESDFVVTFEQFYNDYPLKRNRHRAAQEFNKLNKTDQVKAYYNLHHYKKYLHKNSWLSPMIADTYLRKREFETEWNKIK